MTSPRNVSGVWVATLTPLGGDGGCDAVRLAAHCRWLFDAGCDGVALFGTTGEGPSFTVAERRRALDAVLGAGIPARRVLLGTGSAALPDAAELNRAATEAGCAGALMLPPFFFKQVDGEGVYRCFAQAIERTGDPRLKLYLYAIPSHSAVALDFDTIDRLRRDFPHTVVGIKDSTLDWRHTEPLLARFRDLEILTGAEHHVPQALAAGATGTICGLANIAPALVRALADARDPAAAAVHLKRIEALIAAVASCPFVPAVKAVAAARKRDPAWRDTRPPLHALDRAEADALCRRVIGLVEPAAALGAAS
ncbi:MAG: dihydrodipicolinate synthase family protein [Alphaproteobacteria bacterium]|nr:dihydrodipicolinate synthase family protein [Alphaproteobacteria bacterium]